MTGFIYNIGIYLYNAALCLASPFHAKAKLLREGRKAAGICIRNFKREGNVRYVWFHAASLGEFEQGRPVIEELKKKDPSVRILLTFFSPSGYEVRKNYKGADIIIYLPSDTVSNVRAFLDAFRPDAAVIVKYEYWYNYLTELKRRAIPVYLISAIFLPSQPFFKWWGGLYREMLDCFTRIFVQDEPSGKLLEGLGVHHFTVSGDTRFDRVASIAAAAETIPQVEKFLGGRSAVVCGSTWPPDEKNLLDFINRDRHNVKWIIAPHETKPSRIKEILSLTDRKTACFSENREDIAECDVLVIDCIGLLSSIYRYAGISYIGGGFGVGIHNTLEAAVYGIPVIFGPNHKRFREALGLLDCGGGFTYTAPEELDKILEKMLDDENSRQTAGAAADRYVKSQLGATELIIKRLVP